MVLRTQLRRKLPVWCRPRRRKLEPKYVPVWTGVFEKRGRAWARKNQWRVCHVLASEEDGVQEAALVFAKCCDKYRYTVDNSKWFMSLFNRALVNRWHGLARADEEQRELISMNIDDVYARLETIELFDEESLVRVMRARVPELNNMITFNEAPLRIALEEAPVEIRRAIEVCLQGPPEVIRYIMAPLPDRAAFNKRIRAICGLRRQAIDIVGEFDNLVRND